MNNEKEILQTNICACHKCLYPYTFQRRQAKAPADYRPETASAISKPLSDSILTWQSMRETSGSDSQMETSDPVLQLAFRAMNQTELASFDEQMKNIKSAVQAVIDATNQLETTLNRSRELQEAFDKTQMPTVESIQKKVDLIKQKKTVPKRSNLART